MSQLELETHLAWVEEMVMFAESEESNYRDFEGQMAESFIGGLDLWLGDDEF